MTVGSTLSPISELLRACPEHASALKPPNMVLARDRAIERAVVAPVEFLGLTHGDAMAENVMVDLAPRRCPGRPEHSSTGDAGVANWFDSETIQ
jgi:hypothetical protein